MTHEECVDAWLAANVEDERDARRVLDSVADAMRALRFRSGASIGEGAAAVIFERLVGNVPRALDGLSLDDACRGSCDDRRDEVVGASRALLLETLGVLAALTGDALTTALHAELGVGAHDHASPPSRPALKRRARP